MTGLELIILEYLFIFIESLKIIWIWPSCAFPQYSGLWVTAVDISAKCSYCCSWKPRRHENTLAIYQQDQSLYCLCNNDAHICIALVTFSKCFYIRYLTLSSQRPSDMVQSWHSRLEVIKPRQREVSPAAEQQASSALPPDGLPLFCAVLAD